MNKKIKALIVIVTYNRADVTKVMLESLYEVKTNVDFDLYVVDNLSQTTELSEIRNTFNALKEKYNLNNILIENKTNSGYSAANNLGIRHAVTHKDDYTHICLLNNDTIVTDHWLERMIARDNKKVLIGPVSNSVGNEQRVPFDYDLTQNYADLKKSINAYSDLWFKTHQGQVEKSKMLGFFCVLGSVEIFSEVGELDENFGIGMFEDDDLCQRILKNNYELLIARDVFIHHWGSASFSKLKKAQFYSVFDKNRSYWEQKHNQIWKSYNTTTLDAFAHELKWHVQNPSEVTQKAIVNFEATVKYQLQHEYDVFDLIYRGSLAEILFAWENQNIHASAGLKNFVLLFAYCAQILPFAKKTKKLNFSEIIQRMKKNTNEN